jgi:hypothetical protein
MGKPGELDASQHARPKMETSRRLRGILLIAKYTHKPINSQIKNIYGSEREHAPWWREQHGKNRNAETQRKRGIGKEREWRRRGAGKGVAAKKGEKMNTGKL